MIIRFSHMYYKLLRAGNTAKLLAVFPVQMDDLHKDFVQYDTEILSGGYGKLPSGDLVVLLFIGRDNTLFTTIRKRIGSHGDNLEYYSKHIGEIFDVVIEKETGDAGHKD